MNVDDHQAPADATLDQALQYVRVWSTVLKAGVEESDAMKEIAGRLGLERARQIAHRALDRHMDAGAEPVGEAAAEAPTAFRAAFQTPHEQHRDRNGQPFTLVRKIEEPDATHDAEVLPMYVVRFDDGVEIEAWPDEVEAEK